MDSEVNGEVLVETPLKGKDVLVPFNDAKSQLTSDDTLSSRLKDLNSEAMPLKSSNSDLVLDSDRAKQEKLSSDRLLSNSLVESTGKLDSVSKNSETNKLTANESSITDKLQNSSSKHQSDDILEKNHNALPLVKNNLGNGSELSLSNKESSVDLNSQDKTSLAVSPSKTQESDKDKSTEHDEVKSTHPDDVEMLEDHVESTVCKNPKKLSLNADKAEKLTEVLKDSRSVKEASHFTSISSLVGHKYDLTAKTYTSSNESSSGIQSPPSDSDQNHSTDTEKNALSSGDQNCISKVSKCKDLESDSQREPDPLSKLNEHLNSIGFQDKLSHSFDQIERRDFPNMLNTEISKSCYKENKNPSMSCLPARPQNEPSDSLIFTELSNEETGFPDVFTGHVTIGKYISVKGDFTLRSSEALIESPSVIAPYLLKEPDSFPSRESKYEQKEFFQSTAGQLLIGIGISRVNEWFHRDMTRIKKWQIKKEGKLPNLEEELALHRDCYLEAKKANSVYSFPHRSCDNCGFTTESATVMEGHRLVPHVTARREYECNFCKTINRDPKAMLEHMLKSHGKVGRIQPPVLFFECPYCTTFESNSKTKLNIHLAKCFRFFDAATNQAPPRDFEFPALTPKPITVAVVKAYEKSLTSMQRGRGRPKKTDSFTDSLSIGQFTPNLTPTAMLPNHIPPYRPNSGSPLSESLSLQNQIIPPIPMPNMSIRSHTSPMNSLPPSMPPMHLASPSTRFFPVNSMNAMMPMLGNSHLVTSSSQFPFSPSLVNSGTKKVHAPTAPLFNNLFGSGIRQQSTPKSIPEVTITPLPKLQGPYPVPSVKPNSAPGISPSSNNSMVVCEICDGYIKDLEQLRTHMQLIHKVKIHPKMLASRPPLNCQKCQWRFFTDQGLERHLLGTHGLVTSNMQELANKGKDAGCCTICGRVYASKLVTHMNQTHKVTLKPAHLSYKCTVCSATFNLYRLFENHVYLVHSGAAKRAAATADANAAKKLKLDSYAESETANHKERRTSGDLCQENVRKCVGCGCDVSHAHNNDKCEKCLKTAEKVQMQGTFSQAFRDELRKNDKRCEEATC
ncbi:MOG interacting and ectopic P-granules protein 1-like [Uloborus diversus]|uniref:MOG interacting and ectopic P-granules protein 1-like n=1 Tax=Uloborus diversus TaxID=327109 RepID=UPI00240A8CDB|nr:MOG interacting and ectopic P-granules protein 1-like [Uloborus diversus]